ncbi:septin-5-like isoform X2 [Amblyraja radiata]|uniref:septin-5-like isoform X2 n=1 Tax=Amblyraja radiata TaxID=386614 RepID=UPI001403EFC6|nr:septin-5-like isoform X2 [Amblyraja radiata]
MAQSDMPQANSEDGESSAHTHTEDASCNDHCTRRTSSTQTTVGQKQLAHFLKEDSDDSEVEWIMKENGNEKFPVCVIQGNSPINVIYQENLEIKPGISETLNSNSPGTSDVERDQFWQQPFQTQRSDGLLVTIESMSHNSTSRPKSPFGKLDPYDSSEMHVPATPSLEPNGIVMGLWKYLYFEAVNLWKLPPQIEKEYVGFATLPNQVHRKSVKKGFDFTLLVAGESGLGKSTLVNSLFLTDLYKAKDFLDTEERITQTVEITKHSVEIEEKGIRLRLTIVDTPGFGDAVNNQECWKPVADYLDQQFEQYFRDESGLNRKNIVDNRVHCCLYFISPFGHGLRPLDVEFMKAVHDKVNIVPILAKADTLTPAEVNKMKSKIREEIKSYGIKIYQFPDCDSDEDDEFKQQDQELKDSIPFTVIGSNTVVEAKGRRVRGRLYPWGIVEVENPTHCDFVKLRNMLIRTHMQDLKDVTRDVHYENYRAQCIQSMTRMVVKERNRNKLTRESGTDFPIPIVSGLTDNETEKIIREKDEELRRMQEMLQKIQQQMHGQKPEGL